MLPLSAAREPVSAHRAFLYSACAPGIGDIYSGFRLRGYATFIVFLFFSFWLIWILASWMNTFLNQLLNQVNGLGSQTLPDIPDRAMGWCILGIGLVWIGSMLLAVDGAVCKRLQRKRPPQSSVAWALLMSWLCPGAGHIYTGRRWMGFLLSGVYLMGILLMFPVYMNLFRTVSDIAGSGQLNLANVQDTVSQLSALFHATDFSFGTILQDTIKGFAIAGALAALSQNYGPSAMNWLKPSWGYGLSLIGIGWLCPGAGQLLQRRYGLGWGLFSGYIGLTLFIGRIANQEVITLATADQLGWLVILVQWAAALEAPSAMRVGITPSDPGTAST